MIQEIDSGKGCDYGKCTFCNVPYLFPKHVEIEPKIVARSAAIAYDNGYSPVLTCPSHSKEWLKAFAAEGVPMWSAFIRANRLNGNSGYLKRGGLHCAMVGAEYLSDAVLSRMQKGIFVSDIFRAAISAINNGIHLRLFFMSGFPNISKDEKLEHLENLESLLSLGNFQQRTSVTVSPYIETKTPNADKNPEYLRMRLGWP